MVSLSFRWRISSGRNRWRDDVIPAEASDSFIKNLFVDDALHLKRLYLHSWHTHKTSLYVTQGRTCCAVIPLAMACCTDSLVTWATTTFGKRYNISLNKATKAIWSSESEENRHNQHTITDVYIPVCIVYVCFLCKIYTCMCVCTHTHTYIPINLSNISLIMASLSAITFCDDLKCFSVLNEFQPCQEGVKCIRSDETCYRYLLGETRPWRVCVTFKPTGVSVDAVVCFYHDEARVTRTRGWGQAGCGGVQGAAGVACG